MPDFGEVLNNPSGYGSLVDINTKEIKLAEQMKVYVEKRAKIDTEYADKLCKLHAGVSISSSESTSLIEKAWRTFITEGENKSIIISHMSKTLSSSSVGRIDKLIRYKKKILNDFIAYQNRVEKDFHCCTDEVKRLNDSYRDTARELGRAKERMNNNTIKLKGEKDLKKFCERIDKASRKLNYNHNEYVIAIAAANEHQRIYNKNVRPHLCNTMEELMELGIREWKSCLQELYKYTVWSNEQLFTSAAEMQQSIEAVDPNIEYEGFLIKCKEEKGKPILPFFFDATLVPKETDLPGVQQNEISLNDLTFQQLHNKSMSLQSQIETLTSSIESQANNLSLSSNENEEKQSEESDHEEKNEEVEKQKIKQEENEIQNRSTLSLFHTIDKIIEKCNQSREIQELTCKRDVANVQWSIVNPLLEGLGDNPPPSYAKFDSSSSGLNIADLKENGSLMSKFSRPSATLPRLLSNMMTKRRASVSKSNFVSSSPQDKDTPSELNTTNESNDDLGEYVEPTEDDVLDEQSWFHGKLVREDVAKLLKCDGDFLVREKSDGSGDCVLSVMAGSQIKHFILKRQTDGMFKFEASAFVSIPQLIHHHMKNHLAVSMTNNVYITHPIEKAFLPGDKYCYSHNDVVLGDTIGKGHFGDVYKGFLKSKDLTVAVKTCRNNCDEATKRMFLTEAEIMKPYDHENVVKLVGVCNDNQPYYILMEFAPFGDLLNYLKKNGESLDAENLVKISVDVANGMSYLESKQTIHRDLAARNCLVGDEYKIKICDFGMSREEDEEGIYSVHTTKEFPVKWTAPEVWQYRQYTTKSDVWSFGIVLWEVFSLGNTPYPGWNNPKSREAIEQGYRMPPPNGTPPSVYEVMQLCWKQNAEERPVFTEIYNKLVSIAKMFN